MTLRMLLLAEPMQIAFSHQYDQEGDVYALSFIS